MRREWHIWEKILAIENCREAVRREALTKREKLTLASLYGYVKHGESCALQDMWDAARASRVFRTIGTTAKEASSGVIEI